MMDETRTQMTRATEERRTEVAFLDSEVRRLVDKVDALEKAKLTV